VGRDVGAITLLDLEGHPRNLSEFRGKTVLLDFWATWCAPCLSSLPIYDTWQAELAPRGLVILAVSVDDEDINIRNFVKKVATNLTILRDKGGRVAETFDLPTMPTAFLIGPDGRIRWRHEGFASHRMAGLKEKILHALVGP
jgi:thiol-disulfide isomerase/thioredoxin